MAKNKPYTCEVCHGRFIGVSEEEAAEEAVRLWGAPENIADDPAAAGYAVVCDVCFKRLTAEYPPEQFKADTAFLN